MLVDGVEHRQRIILSSKPISYIAPSMRLYSSFIETKDDCQRTCDRIQMLVIYPL
jgi:hypothetical protein